MTAPAAGHGAPWQHFKVPAAAFGDGTPACLPIAARTLESLGRLPRHSSGSEYIENVDVETLYLPSEAHQECERGKRLLAQVKEEAHLAKAGVQG